ncbi:hypothetical protein [Cohnella fermenti]|uniref:Uncharacterized protein n=1 Tax=Cohnella fermenti TaxID=2565925 RepID=A0A4S4BP21_9BACL|nr:hypothetical protein [Cohnella fermenti]THF75737.1 hypothetical protein E6C55_21020 [Cohnella fermenti]
MSEKPTFGAREWRESVANVGKTGIWGIGADGERRECPNLCEISYWRGSIGGDMADFMRKITFVEENPARIVAYMLKIA